MAQKPWIDRCQEPVDFKHPYVRAICRFIKKHGCGYRPALAEMLGIPETGIEKHIRRLTYRGFLKEDRSMRPFRYTWATGTVRVRDQDEVSGTRDMFKMLGEPDRIIAIWSNKKQRSA